jgi:hypothetical protein
MKQDILNFIDTARRTIKVEFDYSNGHGALDSLNAQAASGKFRSIPGVESVAYREFDKGSSFPLEGICLVTVADEEDISGVMTSLKEIAKLEDARVTAISKPFVVT